MLISELIVRHIDPQGALHERGIGLTSLQAPTGVRFHPGRDDDVAVMAGDVVVVSAPAGLGLGEQLDLELPVDSTVILLLELKIPELPVGRVLSALAVAKLQVVEATAVSDTVTETVAVVAVRTDELAVPRPYLAHDLEPGSNQPPAVLRRLLGEHVLEGLVQRARERVLLADVGEGEARLREMATELEQLAAVRLEVKALVAEREYQVAEREHVMLDIARVRAERDAEREQMRSLRLSTTFRLASRLARLSGVVRRPLRRSGSRHP